MDRISKGATHDLAILEHASRTLAQAKTLYEVKSIRDKAEAARQYAKSAALGLRIQNLAAELKLRAERKAGDLLAKLSLRGGDRKSKSRHEILKLADIGIDRNKSARWQLEASIPENVFCAYLAAADESGLEITSQGLFRLAKKTTPRRRRDPARSDEQQAVPDDGCSPDSSTGANRTSQRRPAAVARTQDDATGSKLVEELEQQRNLIAAILAPLYEDRQPTLAVVSKRTLARLLCEMQELLAELKTALS